MQQDSSDLINSRELSAVEKVEAPYRCAYFPGEKENGITSLFRDIPLQSVQLQVFGAEIPLEV